jgi:hypothetical protein
MIEVVPLLPEHVAAIRPDDRCLMALSLAGLDLRAAVSQYRERGVFWAGLAEGRVVGGAGLVLYEADGKRVGQALAFMDRELVRAHTVGVVRAIRVMFDSLLDELRLDLAEAFVAEGWERGLRFARCFGFLPEEGVHDYPHGRYVRCVRTRTRHG